MRATASYSCLFIVKDVYFTNKNSNKIMENSFILTFCFSSFSGSLFIVLSKIFFGDIFAIFLCLLSQLTQT